MLFNIRPNCICFLHLFSDRLHFTFPHGCSRRIQLTKRHLHSCKAHGRQQQLPGELNACINQLTDKVSQALQSCQVPVMPATCVITRSDMFSKEASLCKGFLLQYSPSFASQVGPSLKAAFCQGLSAEILIKLACYKE